MAKNTVEIVTDETRVCPNDVTPGQIFRHGSDTYLAARFYNGVGTFAVSLSTGTAFQFVDLVGDLSADRCIIIDATIALTPQEGK